MTSVKHPMLHLEVLSADGTREVESSVFCRLKRKSVRVDNCCGCVHCDAITYGETAVVACTIPIAEPSASDDPSGEYTEIGTLLCRGTVVVAQSNTLRAALDVLRAEDRRAVAVVDDNHVLVGVVHETAVLGRRPGAPLGGVVGAMTNGVAIHESTPVRVALRLLAASHLREATVISDDGRPIGVFTDVDGLRWIAGARAAG